MRRRRFNVGRVLVLNDPQRRRWRRRGRRFRFNVGRVLVINKPRRMRTRKQRKSRGINVGRVRVLHNPLAVVDPHHCLTPQHRVSHPHLRRQLVQPPPLLALEVRQHRGLDGADTELHLHLSVHHLHLHCAQ